MGTIFEVAQPSFESGGVVFADHLTVCDNVGFATDACPLAGGIEERDIDFGIGFQIVRLARLCVGMKK